MKCCTHDNGSKTGHFHRLFLLSKDRRQIFYTMSRMLFFLLCASSTKTVKSMKDQCLYVVDPSFQSCTTREGELERYKNRDIYRVYNSSREHDERPVFKSGRCTDGCRDLYQTARIRHQSFASDISIHIAEMIARCCSGCARFYQTDIQPPMDVTNRTLSDLFDITYPIYAPKTLKPSKGFYFLPVLNIPSAYLITVKKSEKQMALDLMLSCFKLWPLVVICLLLSLIAGFFIWILETWKNEEQFPRDFVTGVWEGMWWSVVSMTTVGYGDKFPKSKLARIFAVVWLFVGITACSIFVANLASDIMDSKSPGNTEMLGKKVGTLKGKIFDAVVVSQYGGVVEEIDSKETVVGISELVRRLVAGEIDAVLVSRSLYYFYAREVQEKLKYKKYLVESELQLEERSFLGEQLVAGMLMKSQQDYIFFKRYFELNWATIQACFSYKLNYKKKKFAGKVMNPMEGLFYPFLYGCLVVLALILCFGVLFEVKRRRNGVRQDRL